MMDNPSGVSPARTVPEGWASARQPFFAGPSDQENEPDLFALVRVMCKRWWVAAILTVLGTSGTYLYAMSVPRIYRARATIAPPEQKKPSGASAAVAAIGGIGAELASSMGIPLGGGSENTIRLETLLRSHRLVERIVKKHDLLPMIFREKWDPASKTWKVKTPAEVPDLWDADRVLGKMVVVTNDLKAGILSLSCESEDIGTATDILRYYLEELALLVQEDEMKKIEINRQFVEEQLRKAADPVIIAKLQSMLSDQVEKAMMARNMERLAYDLLDPPAGPNRPVKPNKRLMLAFGFSSSLLAGIMLVFSLAWLESARRGRRSTEP